MRKLYSITAYAVGLLAAVSALAFSPGSAFADCVIRCESCTIDYKTGIATCTNCTITGCTPVAPPPGGG
jgi:hypothetical protein